MWLVLSLSSQSFNLQISIFNQRHRSFLILREPANCLFQLFNLALGLLQLQRELGRDIFHFIIKLLPVELNLSLNILSASLDQIILIPVDSFEVVICKFPSMLHYKESWLDVAQR